MENLQPLAVDITTVDTVTVDAITIAKYVTISGIKTPLTGKSIFVIGAKTLDSDFVIDVNADPFITGDTIYLLFLSNIVANGHQVLIHSQNFTALLATGAPIFIAVRMMYDGTLWHVESLDKKIMDMIAAISPVLSVAGKTGVVTLAPADVSLGLVENTRLSTWAGTANITTLGTIVTGVWQGTKVGDNYISSAGFWNAKANAANANLTGNVAIPTRETGESADYAASTKYVQRSLGTYSEVAWAATINLSGVVPLQRNTVVLASITGDTEINADVFAGDYSEVDIILPFGGSHTVSAGTNIIFADITGASSQIYVLTLVWYKAINKYIQKSVSQN